MCSSPIWDSAQSYTKHLSFVPSHRCYCLMAPHSHHLSHLSLPQGAYMAFHFSFLLFFVQDDKKKEAQHRDIRVNTCLSFLVDHHYKHINSALWHCSGCLLDSLSYIRRHHCYPSKLTVLNTLVHHILNL